MVNFMVGIFLGSLNKWCLLFMCSPKKLESEIVNPLFLDNLCMCTDSLWIQLQPLQGINGFVSSTFAQIIEH